MAKPNTSKSVLRAAWEAFGRGDAVEARRLAQAVLAGQHGKDDEAAAKDLARLLSSTERPVAETLEAVARELVDRTIVPPRPYLFVGAAALAFITLVTLAAIRY